VEGKGFYPLWQWVFFLSSSKKIVVHLDRTPQSMNLAELKIKNHPKVLFGFFYIGQSLSRGKPVKNCVWVHFSGCGAINIRTIPKRPCKRLRPTFTDISTAKSSFDGSPRRMKKISHCSLQESSVHSAGRAVIPRPHSWSAQGHDSLFSEGLLKKHLRWFSLTLVKQTEMRTVPVYSGWLDTSRERGESYSLWD